MRLSRQQTDAINGIIQERLQEAVQTRDGGAEHMRRSRLFEAVVGTEKKAAAQRIAEAATLLAEARDLLHEGTDLHEQAGSVADLAYDLAGLCEGDVGLTEDDLSELDAFEEAEEVELPPMHPRGREERPSTVKPVGAPKSSAPPASRPLSAGGGYGDAIDDEFDLPPMHPRGR